MFLALWDFQSAKLQTEIRSYKGKEQETSRDINGVCGCGGSVFLWSTGIREELFEQELS